MENRNLQKQMCCIQTLDFTRIFFDITDTSVSREGTSKYRMTQIWGTLLWTQHQWQCPPALSMCQCAAAHWQLQGENVSMELQILGGKRPIFLLYFIYYFQHLPTTFL